jgi:S1-C subfamily serine protease
MPAPLRLDPSWRDSGVQQGDVITRLNGQPIERPEQAMVAFDSLRVASEVAVEIVRDGQPMRLRYRVE